MEAERHSLLDVQTPAYSNVTVRRALAVWMHLGRRNRFQDVCNYFHYLEIFEENLSTEQRASSRQHEFDLFTNQPPTSTFLLNNFPFLYPHPITKEMPTEPQNGVTKEEILETSKLIQKYCLSNSISLKHFLLQFKVYAKNNNLKYTVQNVTNYINKNFLPETLIGQSVMKSENNYFEYFLKESDNNCTLTNNNNLDNVKDNCYKKILKRNEDLNSIVQEKPKNVEDLVDNTVFSVLRSVLLDDSFEVLSENGKESVSPTEIFELDNNKENIIPEIIQPTVQKSDNLISLR